MTVAVLKKIIHVKDWNAETQLLVAVIIRLMPGKPNLIA